MKDLAHCNETFPAKFPGDSNYILQNRTGNFQSKRNPDSWRSQHLPFCVFLAFVYHPPPLNVLLLYMMSSISSSDNCKVGRRLTHSYDSRYQIQYFFFRSPQDNFTTLCHTIIYNCRISGTIFYGLSFVGAINIHLQTQNMTGRGNIIKFLMLLSLWYLFGTFPG